MTRNGHHEWFVARVANPLVQLYVVEDYGDPVGQVRIDSNGEISFSVDEMERLRGVATRMLREAVRKSQWDRLKASVDVTNVGGILSLEKAGFKVRDDVVFLRWP